MNVGEIRIDFDSSQRFVVVRRFSGPSGSPPLQIIASDGRSLWVVSATELLAIYQAIGAVLYGVRRSEKIDA